MSIGAEQLRRAVRDLSNPPTTPGWNAPELADLFDTDIRHREAAVLVPFVRRGEALSLLFTQRAASLRGAIGYHGTAPCSRAIPAQRTARSLHRSSPANAAPVAAFAFSGPA